MDDMSNWPTSFLDWSPEQARQFGHVAQSAKHRVHELPWFDDAGLLKLIENQPRTNLRVFQSGIDPKHRHRDHQPVDTEGVNASEILESVKRGKLWVNLQRIDAAQSHFDNLGRKLYREIQSTARHFHPVWINRAFLFISSPGAMVYLHADYQPNMLWHLRGDKTIWIYPPYHKEIVSDERMQEICAGGEDDIPFEYSYDDLGQPFSISPGDTVSWPARAPHRVVNGDNVNVSLSTFHETAEDYDRVLEHRADYLIRTQAPWFAPIAAALGSSFKRNLFKVTERVGMAKGRPVREYWTKLRIDPSSPNGVREIAGGPVLAEHSKLAKKAAAA